MTTVYNILCMLCGRSSGQVRGGQFYRAAEAPLPVWDQGRNHCGFCSGNLFLEPDDSGIIPYTMPDTVARRKAS